MDVSMEIGNCALEFSEKYLEVRFFHIKSARRNGISDGDNRRWGADWKSDLTSLEIESWVLLIPDDFSPFIDVFRR